MSRAGFRLRLTGEDAENGASNPEIPMLAATLPAAPHDRRIGRRIAAVLAGLFTIFAVTTLVDIVMHATGIFPPMDGPPMGSALFAVAFGYRFAIDVGGCYLTARIAPDRPMQHALILGAIGFVLSTAGAIAMWGAGPAWYPIGLALSALPCAWIGGRLARQPGQSLTMRRMRSLSSRA
jgi:hypothetical protein